MWKDSQTFIKLDVSILVVTLIYYVIAQFKINASYSSGYQGIWTYFTLVHSVMILFQILLLICDWRNGKTWVLSLRSGAFMFVLGNTVIVSFLGLLSIWLIIFFAFVEGAHVLLFSRGLEMKNDGFEQQLDEELPRNDDYSINRETSRYLLNRLLSNRGRDSQVV